MTGVGRVAPTCKISALGQEDYHKFQTSLVNIGRSLTAKATPQDPVSEEKRRRGRERGGNEIKGGGPAWRVGEPSLSDPLSLWPVHTARHSGAHSGIFAFL